MLLYLAGGGHQSGLLASEAAVADAAAAAGVGRVGVGTALEADEGLFSSTASEREGQRERQPRPPPLRGGGGGGHVAAEVAEARSTGGRSPLPSAQPLPSDVTRRGVASQTVAKEPIRTPGVKTLMMVGVARYRQVPSV
jgi:hypothetical protein